MAEAALGSISPRAGRKPRPAPALLVVRPGWSWWLFGYWAAVHLGAALVVAILPATWGGRLLLVALVASSAAWRFALHFWRRLPWSIMEAMRTRDGWELVLATGEALPARLLGSSFVSQGLIVMNFAIGRWQRLALPLASDSLEPNLMRRLRAELRLGRVGALK